jgi:hypothetical protein
MRSSTSLSLLLALVIAGVSHVLANEVFPHLDVCSVHQKTMAFELKGEKPCNMVTVCSTGWPHPPPCRASVNHGVAKCPRRGCTDSGPYQMPCNRGSHVIGKCGDPAHRTQAPPGTAASSSSRSYALPSRPNPYTDSYRR